MWPTRILEQTPGRPNFCLKYLRRPFKSNRCGRINGLFNGDKNARSPNGVTLQDRERVKLLEIRVRALEILFEAMKRELSRA